ncbi:MAG TPA: hypothetical protein VI757_08635 [Bacteroidia bacterium]|nr:hypothetical protein [Bacteroidia bacterium]
MEFNIYARFHTFDMASEVYMVAPALLLSEKLSYVGDESFIIHEYFSERKDSDRLIIRFHKIMFDKQKYPEMADIDYDNFLTSYLKAKQIRHPNKQTLILLQTGKNLIRTMKQNIDGWFAHYMNQFGFNVLGPFFRSGQLIPMLDAAPKDNVTGEDSLIEDFHQLLTEKNQLSVVTDEFDLVLDVKHVDESAPLPDAAEVLCFPLVTFPVLKRLTEEQMVSLNSDLRAAVFSFNANMQALNEKLGAVSFSPLHFSEIDAMVKQHAAADRATLNDLLSGHVYLKQVRNSHPEEGEVTFYIAVSSVQKFLECYEKLSRLEPYVIERVMQRAGEAVSPGQCILFLYTKCTAPEVPGSKEVAVMKRAKQEEGE